MRNTGRRGINFVYAMLSAVALAVGGLVVVMLGQGDMLTIGWVFLVLGVLLIAANLFVRSRTR